MILDKLTLVSNAQAFTAAAVSTDSIDLGNVSPKRQIGSGEPVGYLFSVGVAASSTTVKLEAIMATDAALTSGIIVLCEATRLSADLPAGAVLFLGLPPGGPAAGWLRYHGIRATPSGGAATVTLSAALVPQSFVSAFFSYARGVTIL